MRTDRDLSDVVGVTDVPDLSVVRHTRKQHTESGDTHRLMLVLAVDRPRFTIIAMSARAARALGTRSEDARGRALAEALWLTTSDEAGVDSAALTASIERVIRTGKPEAMPLRRCHISHPHTRSGSESPRWWSLMSFPMLGPDGRVSHIVQRLEDVTGTAQMQLVQDLCSSSAPRVSMTAVTTAVPRALRALDKQSPSLVFVGVEEPDRARLRAGFDDAGYRISWACNEQEALTMCTQGRPDCVVLDLSSPEKLRMCRALREQPSCAYTAIICLAPRRDTAVLDRALMAGADELLEKPVTPRELLSHVQALLLQLPGMTEDARRVCQSLRQQRLRLCSLQLQQERTASYIVHDLKEPLSTIDLRAALLLLDTSLPEQARILIERMRTQVRSALLQVLNLLDIRMLDEGHLEARCESVDLFRMVRELLTDFHPRAQARALTLHSDIAVPQIIADPDLLRRTLANLLDNAIRHAPNNSGVAITAHRISGARVELRVVDAGASIPPSMVERIFEPHVQLDDAPCRSRAGRGLGLAFCKLAVQAHRGEISVSTVQNRTVFSIKLPENYTRSHT